jgi:hypothetical protein
MGRTLWSVVPPNLGCRLTKTPVVMHNRGKRPASLISGTAETAYTLCLDNGGSSGAGYSDDLSPCNSKVHSALRFVLVLVNVFVY